MSEDLTTSRADPAGPVPAGGRHRAPWRRRVVALAALAGIAAVILVTGWVVLRQERRQVRADAGEALTAVRRLQSGELERWLADQRADARVLGTSPAVIEPLERYLDAGGRGLPPAAVTDILTVSRRSHSIQSITVLDRRLRVVCASPADAEAPTRQGLAAAAGALATGECRFTDVYRTPSGAPGMDLAVPMVDVTPSPDAVIGVLLLHMDPELELFPLVELWPMTRPSGESVLGSVRGGVVVNVNPVPLGHVAPLGRRIPLSQTETPVVKAARGVTGVVTGVDYRGVPVLASVGRVPRTPWYLVAKQDLAEIDGPVRFAALATVAWVAGVIVIGVLVTVLYRRSREARALRQRLAEQAEHRRLEERYATLMREAKDLVVLFDGELRIVEANEYALATYGYARDEFIGRSLEVYRVAQPAVAAGDRLRQAEAAGGHLTYESVHRRRDGSEFPVEVSLSAVGMDGETMYLQVASDITERKAAERALAELNATLERRVQERTAELVAANAEMEAFAYSVSHDLRAPLRALDGFSLALVEDHGAVLDEAATDYLARIRAASQRMARLIDDLLALSRIARRDVERQSVDVSALAREIVAGLREHDPGRLVAVDVAPGMRVAADPGFLRVALQNLLDNAWKFTAEAAEARIEVGVGPGEDGRVFHVRDNGAGFDPSYADKLFAPFQRLHREDEFPGTGIGLAIVQRIVRRHGGRVWAEGETGNGATLYFTLGPLGEV